MDQIFDTCFSQTINTPTMMASRPLTPPMTDAVPTTIKMEDLQVPFDVPSPTPSAFTSASQPGGTTPTPSGSESKAVKKRKSWGQVLPEPKTALPPRKRAKTDDEKEQRRIERVKRNRLAAHNSRERKRQEYELLQEEKDKMDADLQYCKQQLAQMKAELEFFRTKYPGEAVESSVVFDPTTSFTTEAPDTICPAQTSTSFPSPESMDSMDSPCDSLSPETPVSFEATLDSDLTQYPAVVLCDLQFDEKPQMENLFDFDQFPEAPASMEPSTGLPDSVDFFGSAFTGHNSNPFPYGFSDGFDAKFSDLQSASGATFVSDEALAADY
ncbi:hypothetical protein P153DRAFT_282681 [Dothidotthia symphoricarpi CBS 119687]|uniref:BZIP domain-containing protein n=1 Tax=Dothidotthia symphoricarpi CBS 119687 TaxID=1392245 RepID=A0A6A6ANQ4_9PLEO|nr:uncharacterized protein P153DRAFT_282681 [Dothidotthia symphoricarpi CBS 119687]KAF2133166.1 hypothetical protein P153DRAFT_282681 [Dothidotthia symphoricarpi CBS 119687]